LIKGERSVGGGKVGEAARGVAQPTRVKAAATGRRVSLSETIAKIRQQERKLAVPCEQCAMVNAANPLPTGQRWPYRRCMALDDDIIDTPDGPMTWAEWKKKNPVQVPSRRTKGKNLPRKVKRFTGDE
jgi:hypothetical protein